MTIELIAACVAPGLLIVAAVYIHNSFNRHINEQVKERQDDE